MHHLHKHALQHSLSGMLPSDHTRAQITWHSHIKHDSESQISEEFWQVDEITCSAEAASLLLRHLHEVHASVDQG